MIGYEVAREIATRTHLGNHIVHCSEWENGYAFSCTSPTAGVSYDGGPGTPVVVHKESGTVMGMIEFINMGAGDLLREFAIKD